MTRIKRDIREIKTNEEESEVYNIARKNRIPAFYINRKNKYSGFMYDMTTVMETRLSDEAVNTINAIMDEEINKLENSNSRIYWGNEVGNIYVSAKKESGHMVNIPLVDCKKMSKQVYDIVMDKSNWEEIDIREFF